MALYDYLGNTLISDVRTDPTLKEENVPADAKIVGDELQNIRDWINNIMNGNERSY